MNLGLEHDLSREQVLVYPQQAHCWEELGAGMMEAICRITQQKLKNVVNESENSFERYVMTVSGWAQAEECELPGFHVASAIFN